MTAIETWTTKMVEALVGESFNLPLEPTQKECEAEAFHLSQRAACLLIQARAQECRHMAGEVMLKMPGELSPLADLEQVAANRAVRRFAMTISQSCWDRSHKLEAVAMAFAQQWPPPPTGTETMICRCAIDHGEMIWYTNNLESAKTDEHGDVHLGPPIESYVCAHCKLPKHGSTQGPGLVTQ